jgi:phytoene dehydrogenase-like protein
MARLDWRCEAVPAAPENKEIFMKSHDVIVIGAGHNGLTAAAYLARAGLDVLVLERNPYIGGAAVSREVYPGFTYSNCSYVSSLMRPEIMRDLELPKYGL